MLSRSLSAGVKPDVKIVAVDIQDMAPLPGVIQIKVTASWFSFTAALTFVPG